MMTILTHLQNKTIDEMYVPNQKLEIRGPESHSARFLLPYISDSHNTLERELDMWEDQLEKYD